MVVKKDGHRAFRKKVRTGCRTCKIRRVKCDETKPSCLRCTGTGRKCDGYEFPDPGAVIAQQVSSWMPGTRAERRAFEFFRINTAPFLCGHFSETFWERNVLQASFSEPSLRHAAVAIGALHETFTTAVTTSENGPVNHFALRQYTQAIASLRTSLSKNQQQTLVALMSCVLFVCFDSLLGQVDSAITHLRSGLDILLSDKSLDMELFTPIFTRLGLQAISFTDDCTAADKALGYIWRVAKLNLRDNLPSDFCSLREARDSLNKIVDSLMQFFYTIPGPHNDPSIPPVRDPIRLGGDARGANGFLSESKLNDILINHKWYSAALENWSTAYDRFLKATNFDLQGKDLRGATLLKIHHTTATIMVASALLAPGETTERFNPAFSQLVTLCTSLVKAELPGQQSFFSSDIGIVAPLYHCALSCRDEKIRLAALKLLQMPRREGMWDSRIASFVVERVIRLESEGIGERGGNPDIVDAIIFKRTPREAADEIDLELRKSGSGHWITFGNLIPWQRPSIFERESMERQLTALKEDLSIMPPGKSWLEVKTSSTIPGTSAWSHVIMPPSSEHNFQHPDV